MSKDSHLALYGNSTLERVFCNKCNGWAIVLDNHIQCCDSKTYDAPSKYKRMSDVSFVRRRPNKKMQEKILNAQNDLCLYCEKYLPDSHIWRNGKKVKLKINWDHMVPYSYSANNNLDNWAASCHICNGIKSNLVFQNLDETRVYIQNKKKQKGYEI